jgi:hypothetical protein
MQSPSPELANYEIGVKEHFGIKWQIELDQLELRHDFNQQGKPITVISANQIDQSSLHGLFNKIRDLGLTILFVELKSDKI